MSGEKQDKIPTWYWEQFPFSSYDVFGYQFGPAFHGEQPSRNWTGRYQQGNIKYWKRLSYYNCVQQPNFIYLQYGSIKHNLKRENFSFSDTFSDTFSDIT